jgi:hypothetical protein
LLLLFTTLYRWGGLGWDGGEGSADWLGEPRPEPLDNGPALSPATPDGLLTGARPAALECPFRSREDFVANGTFDPHARWVALPAEELSAVQTRNPFTGCSARAPRYAKALHVVFPLWMDRTRNLSSGFGSLALQVLDVVRYAVAHGHGVLMPDPVQWTYGESDDAPAVPADAPSYAPWSTTWTTVFHEITDSACLAPDFEVQHVCTSISPLWVEGRVTWVPKDELFMLDRFQGAQSSARNAEILRAAGLEGVIGGDNDVQAVQVLFRWVFRLQPWVRALVDAVAAPALAALAGRAFVGVHIRWGDKVGRGSLGSKGGETRLFPLEHYVSAIACFYGANRGASALSSRPPKLVFVATDDARAVSELRALLGPDHDVVTLAGGSEQGHDETRFNAQGPQAKWREFLTLWASLELLARAELFVGNQLSNFFRVAHVMRLGKPANSSVSVHTMENAGATCCAGPLQRTPPRVGATSPCVYDCTA